MNPLLFVVMFWDSQDGLDDPDASVHVFDSRVKAVNFAKRHIYEEMIPEKDRPSMGGMTGVEDTEWGIRTSDGNFGAMIREVELNKGYINEPPL